MILQLSNPAETMEIRADDIVVKEVRHWRDRWGTKIGFVDLVIDGKEVQYMDIEEIRIVKEV